MSWRTGGTSAGDNHRALCHLEDCGGFVDSGASGRGRASADE